MSQAEDLLNSLSEDEPTTYTLTPDDEPHIVINADRSITVPDELKEIAVQFDHNIETVTFDCPRSWDGHDLSKMHIYVNYQRPDNYMDSYPVDNLYVDESDNSIIHFDWTISGNVTQVKGNITILVCAKLANNEGILERHWNSRPNSEMKILEGMDCIDGIAEQNPDIIERILANLDISGNANVKSVNGFTPDDNGNIELEIPEAINTALAEAKASGEFDGADGKDGQNGIDGKDGTSVTVTNVQESTEDGGSNVITFSDGKTLTVKNGSKGNDGSPGSPGADGYTPVKGTDYYTAADKTEMVNDVIAALPTWTGGSY